jgi:subtilisin-like proprotein convertase family protein
MILRRLAGRLRRGNWSTLILELVVVVVGLFLAFQLDRWYESQRSKSDLQTHLVSFGESKVDTGDTSLSPLMVQAAAFGKRRRTEHDFVWQCLYDQIPATTANRRATCRTT